MPKLQFDLSARLRLAAGVRHKLAKHARGLGMHKPLVITDATVAALPWFAEMVETARGEGLELGVFNEIKPNPDVANVMAAAEHYKQGGHDGLVSVGGGSPMDAAKAVALAVSHEGSVVDYRIDAPQRRRVNASAIAPSIAMPTTAGTGSEVSAGAIILDEETQMKRTVAAAALQPTLVLADPETTLELPPAVTAATGIDALTHCLEAYSVSSFNPVCDGIALEGIRLIASELPAVMCDPHDVEARSGMMIAATMGAMAFHKGLGLCHAMAHPVGAVLGLHHGLSNAVLLPYVLEHNRRPLQDKLVQLSAVLGLSGSGFAAVYEWLMKLLREVGIEPNLEQACPGAREHLDTLVEKTLQEKFYLSTNPVPATAEDIRGILELAVR